MNLCHAAALALVGWYLMAPPYRRDGSLDLNAPLSEWSQLGGAGYDSATACGKARSEEAQAIVKALDSTKQRVKALPDDGDQPISKVDPKTYAQYVKTMNAANDFVHSRCVATDDPRLKGN
jgi:hypothetical protein